MKEQPVYLELDGIYKGDVADGFSLLEIGAILRNLDQAELIRKTETRRWLRLSFQQGKSVKEVLIKEESPLRRFQPLKWLKNFLSDSSLARSWFFSKYLASKSLPVPRPIALFEKRVYGILQKGYFISEFLPNVQTLSDYLNDPILTSTQRNKILSKLAREVKVLHQHGFYHADLKGSNILIEKGAEDPKLCFIDFEASVIYSRLRPAQKIKDLTRLGRALMESVPSKERREFTRHYLEGQIDLQGEGHQISEKIEQENKARLICKTLALGPSVLRELRYGIKKILVIKLRYIGDTLLTAPFLEALKEAFPEASITALVSRGTESVLSYHPAIAELLPLDSKELGFAGYLRFLENIRRRQFDIAIDLTDADRSAFIAYWSHAPVKIGFEGKSFLRNRFLYNILVKADEEALHKIDHHLAVAEAMGRPIRNRELRFFLAPEEQERIRQKVKEKGLNVDQPFVVLHPGARRWYKSWPLEYFSQLGNRIAHELQLPLVLSGGPSDLESIEKIQKGMNHSSFNFAGELNLRESACLFKLAALCVVNDSSPMHIAAAVQTPTVALFGLTDPKNWRPRGEIHQVFSQECPCRPYGHSRECDQGDDHCMRKISVEEVFEAVKARVLKPISS